MLELGQREKNAWRKAEDLLAAMETYFIARFVAAQDAGELDRGLDPVRLGRRLQAEVMGLRAFAQRDVDSAAVHALAEDMALSLEALRINAVMIGTDRLCVPACSGCRMAQSRDCKRG